MRRATRDQMRVALLVALLVALMAAWNTRYAHAEEPWVVTNLDANYQVNADGSVNVTEDYQVDFGTLRLKGIDRSVANVSGSDLHHIQVEVISVDDGQAPVKYERKDASDRFVISAGDPAKLLTGAQRFRFKYRVTRAVNAAADSDSFAWNIRGESPFARILSATITVSAPALIDVSCEQIPLAYTEKPIACRMLGGTSTSLRFATTTDLGAVVGLVVRASLPKGAVAGAVVPTTPTSGPGATTTSETSAESEGKFKPLPTALTLLAGLLGLAWMVRSWRSAGANPPRRVAIAWLGIALVFLVADTATLVCGLADEYATSALVLLVVSVLPIIAGVVVGIVYLRRAGVLDRMFSSEDLLVHWIYAPDEWQRYAEAEYQSRRKLANGNIKLGTILAVVFFVLLVFGAPDEGNSTGLILAAAAVCGFIVAIIALFNGLYVWTANPRRVKAKDVWISLDGVYLFGSLTTWQRNVSLLSELVQVEVLGGAFLGNMLESVKLIEAPNLQLQFGFSYWTRTGKGRDSVEVPVPVGQEQAAHDVLAAFTGGAAQASPGLAATVT